MSAILESCTRGYFSWPSVRRNLSQLMRQEGKKMARKFNLPHFRRVCHGAGEIQSPPTSPRSFRVILKITSRRYVLRWQFLRCTFSFWRMCLFISAFTVAGTGIQLGLELSNGCPYFTADVCASALFLCVLFSAWQQLPRKQQERFHRPVCFFS